MKLLYKLLILFSLIAAMYSCEDYLEKTPEAEYSIEDIFKNFENSQGFIEEMYAMVVDYANAEFWRTMMCLGEDAIGNVGHNSFEPQLDKGNYWAWENEVGSYFSEPNHKPSDLLAINRHGIWHSSWAGIRKANIAIAHAEALLVDASQQEIDAIMGQAYFFRAFFHHEILKFWGSIPYVDKVLNNDWQLPRPKDWSETALKICDDFDKAAALLPEHWDNDDWVPGMKTKGKNNFRVTKGAALAFKGKTLLYAASPLMQGNSGTYEYNKELCAEAAKTLAEVIKIPSYKLVPWDSYGEVFYIRDINTYPFSTEFIFSGSGNISWANHYIRIAFQLPYWGGDANTESPTHNYIHNYFGMKDGLSCDDSPLYDPNDPFVNRDPRFYKWIAVDGDQMIKDIGKAVGEKEVHRFAEFHKDGEHRYPHNERGTQTGYITKKWYPIDANPFDGAEVSGWRAHIRLTDVYLMYAEAAVMAYGINGKPDNFELSALDAINEIRLRAVPDGTLNVNAKYLTDANTFMDEIRREKAVELSYEGHRWMDVRRWKLGTQEKYKLKTELIFERNSEGKPINIREEVILKRVFEEKHYWLPFPKTDTELYEGFEQNPGW